MPALCSSLPSQGHAYFMGPCPYNDDNAVGGFCRGEKFFAPTSPAIIRVFQCPSVVLSSPGRGSGMGLLNTYVLGEVTIRFGVLFW